MKGRLSTVKEYEPGKKIKISDGGQTYSFDMDEGARATRLSSSARWQVRHKMDNGTPARQRNLKGEHRTRWRPAPKVSRAT